MANIYHVVNRGVDKREIFMDDRDRARFIHDLFEFNDKNPVTNVAYSFDKHGRARIGKFEKEEPREFVVNILAFCLMPNHYHLLLQPVVEDGVPKFMKKMNGGYTNYFNKRHERSGSLFEGRYKKALVENRSHFIHLPYYIHLNPLDMEHPEWRDGELSDIKGALDFLRSYKWSSHLDYLGEKNFPSVTQREFLLDFFDGEEGYKESLEGWLKDLNKEVLNNIDGAVLE